MDAKSFLYSKTLWVNVIAVAATLAASKFGVTIDAATQVMILAGINAVLRIVTKQPISFT